MLSWFAEPDDGVSEAKSQIIGVALQVPLQARSLQPVRLRQPSFVPISTAARAAVINHQINLQSVKSYN